MSRRRFDPFFRDFDALTSQLTGSTPRHTVPLDVVRRDDEIEVRIDLPGIDPDTIDLTVERDHLTLVVERPRELTDGERLIASERPSGTFRRQLFLGRELDGSAVRGDYDRGVLTLTIPVAETAKPRKIAIGVGADNGAITGEIAPETDAD